MATTTVKAYGATSATEDLKPLDIQRRAVGTDDVKIDITYCGVCHSDIHTVRNDWKGSTYPVVPGHEIIGRVTEVGSAVSNYKVGDLVGVGCLVDSCQSCASCDQDLEQFCEKGATWTYNSPDKHIEGKQTYGGYASSVVVDNKFVLSIPENLDEAATAPLL
ncbi:MAG: alcohol dehydrogenase catalytic domain-containing protein, partial [Olleya sp.]